ncbi:hypothetical protein M408DRAFT_331484 [Serendipita vermifera MAFF 305830]|uniref:Uncharacterized protein n=1 Tax=Serendipita vermifera MAFF 305830 TaxID=933852 RepID=A0A0C3B0F7_SERVB|nr:hypothetical protein M408DRAFT_331484 [Serendipita vermifera MAFF 305830]
MNRLEELVLKEMNVGHDLFDFLASSKMEDSVLEPPLDSENQLHCLRLVRLQVDIKGGSANRVRKTKRAAKEAAKVRIKAGIPIEKWLVRTMDDITGQTPFQTCDL